MPLRCFLHPQAPSPGLWLAGNEGMEKNMETTVMGYIGAM